MNPSSPTEELLQRAILRLGVRLEDPDNPNAQWQTLDFVVDSGSTFTTIPATRARRLRIPFSEDVVVRPVVLADRVVEHRRHEGTIVAKVKILGFGEREFRWPCHFVEAAIEEGSSPHALGNGTPREPRNCLGLAGVIHDLRLTLDGTPAASEGAPLGWLLLEETGNPPRQTL